MSAPTLKSPKPRRRLGRLVTPARLATAVTWVFWVFTIGTVLQAVTALTRTGALFGPDVPGQPGQPALVWLDIAPPLLQHAGSVLIRLGLAPGVQGVWNGATLGAAHPTAGRAGLPRSRCCHPACSASARSTWRCGWPAPPPATASTPSRPPGWC